MIARGGRSDVGEVEGGDRGRVVHDGDLRDAAAFDRAGEDRSGGAARGPHRADVAVDEDRDRGAGVAVEDLGHLLGADDFAGGEAGGDRGRVGDDFDAGVEDFEEVVEAALAGRGEEGFHDCALERHVGNGCAPATLLLNDAPPGAAGELAGGLRGAVEDRGDAVEGHAEEVVEDEGDPLGRVQGVEDHLEGEADGVGHDRLGLRVGGGGLAGEGRGVVVAVELVLAAGAARAQEVEADAGGDRGEPAAEVLDLGGVGAREAHPGLLDGVVGLARAAEHAERDRAQVAAVLLETLHQDIVAHGSSVKVGQLY